MISKELLSEVMECEIAIVKKPYNKDTEKYVYYDTVNGEEDAINIYELAHKYKEWAFNNGYYLTIYNDAIDVVLQSNCKVLENVTNDTFMYDQKLVFKACQWILDNKENK